MKYNNDVIFILFALIASLVASSTASSPFVSVPAHVKSIYAASDNNDVSGTGDTGAKGGDTGAKGGDTGAKGGDTGAKGGDTGTKGGDTGTKGGDTGTKGGDTGTTRQPPDVNEPCPVSEQTRNPDTGLCESVPVNGPVDNGTTGPARTVPPQAPSISECPPGTSRMPGNTGTDAQSQMCLPPCSPGQIINESFAPTCRPLPKEQPKQPPDVVLPCPSGQKGTNNTGGCESPKEQPNTRVIVSGNCNAVALSDATNNSSSASSAAVTCNNSVVNKNIYQQRQPVN